MNGGFNIEKAGNVGALSNKFTDENKSKNVDLPVFHLPLND